MYSPTPDIETIFEQFDIDETRFAELDENLLDMKRDDGVDLLEARPHEFLYSGNHVMIKTSAKDKVLPYKVGYCLMIMPSIIAWKERFPKGWIKNVKPFYEKFLYLLRGFLNIKFLKECEIEVTYKEEESASDVELTERDIQEGEQQEKIITQQLHSDQKCIDQFANYMTENINKDKNRLFRYTFDSNGQFDTL